MSAQTLPVDNSVTTGKLDNGITYFIKHNDAPRGQVSFHLVHNIGALAEEPYEHGLAHFLEHMTFQGTRHFPDRDITYMLERHGVLFGHDINAVTSENHTIYKLMGVPADDKALLDSCMMVMADWSYALSLEDKKIDKERTVIIEEIKMLDTPEYQMQRKWADLMLQGSRYENHDIIGMPEFIASFPCESLRQFYRKWHRPDLEVVVVVGDIDVKEMEQRLKRIMNDVPKAEGECPLKDRYQLCTIADHDTLRFCDAHSEGARSRSVIVINRIADTRDVKMNSEEYMRTNIIARLFNILAAKRCAEKSKEQGSPLGGCGIHIVPLKRGYFTYQLGASLRSDDETRALRMLMLEGERLRQVGFTAEEMEAGRRQLLSELERGYKYSIIENEDICSKIESHYLDGEPLLAENDYYNICTRILESLTLEQLNDEVKKWSTGKNRTVVVTGPPSEYPLSAEEAADIISRTEKMDYSLYPYEMAKEPEKRDFLAEKPKAGKVKKTKTNSTLGTTEWTLSNGAKVIYKKVEYDKPTVCLRAVRRGGRSLYDIDMLPAAEQVGSWILSSGAGEFNSQTLYQQIKLHNLEFSPSVNLFSSQITGKALPNEAESLFQLMHLYFTQPNLDEKILSAISQQMAMSNRANPLADTVRVMRTNYSPRTLISNADYYAKAKPENVIKVWKDCYGDPTLFTFVLTGNIDEQQAKALAETYLASLAKPKDGIKRLNEWKDDGIRPMKGNNSKTVKINLGRPMAQVVVNFNYETKPNISDIICCNLLSSIFQSRCMQNIREKDGSVYSINVNKETQTVPASQYGITAEFSCSPDDAERLKGKIVEEWNKMAREGVTQAEYDIVVRHLNKKMTENDDKADNWAKYITDTLLLNAETLNPVSYSTTMKSINADVLNDFLRRMSTDGNRLDVTFLSKK